MDRGKRTKNTLIRKVQYAGAGGNKTKNFIAP